MRQFEGILFDIDGTLASTNQLIFDTFNFISKKYLDKTYTPEEIIKLFGPTEDVILQKWMGSRYPEAREDYYKYYRKHHKQMADIYPGIKEILEMIHSKGIPLGIFTGKGREASEITLKEIGIFEYFDMLVTGDDVNNHKPSAEGIIKFVNHYGFESEKVLLVGDSTADVKAAKEAGIKMASALWDSYGKEKVLMLNSDYYFNSVTELKEFLKDKI